LVELELCALGLEGIQFSIRPCFFLLALHLALDVRKSSQTWLEFSLFRACSVRVLGSSHHFFQLACSEAD